MYIHSILFIIFWNRKIYQSYITKFIQHLKKTTLIVHIRYNCSYTPPTNFPSITSPSINFFHFVTIQYKFTHLPRLSLEYTSTSTCRLIARSPRIFRLASCVSSPKWRSLYGSLLYLFVIMSHGSGGVRSLPCTPFPPPRGRLAGT